VSRWPAASSPDGAWPLADEAASRLLARQDVERLALVGLPEAKLPDALRFPLERRGAVPMVPAADEPAPGGAIVVCDPLFEALIGAPCGGPAELAWAERAGVGRTPLDRFTAGDRRVVTVFPAD
jgi:hypothetical protein